MVPFVVISLSPFPNLQIVLNIINEKLESKS